ncbi:MAG: 50S ribosomal protein L29 [Candidatus Margulisiibacteriota bacterium]
MKIKEFKELSENELNKKLSDLRKDLLKARIAMANQQLKNPLSIRVLRKDIARIMTVKSEKGAKVVEK